MSNIQTFNFEQNSVRTFLDENNNPLFVAKDVAIALGYANTKDAIARHCRGVVKHYPIKDSLNRTQNIRVIYEPDVYALIFGSKLSSAVKFQDWVFNEVLPSIRKTGSYRHTISVEQQAQIRLAVAKRCQSNSTHYQTIYTALHQKFGIPRYDELLAKDFDDAIMLIEQYQLADSTPDNAFWCMVGILEYERLSRELDALERTLDSVMRQLTHIRRTKGLLYDALGEQNHISQDPNVVAKAQAFIDRQMAMKRRIGFI